MSTLLLTFCKQFVAAPWLPTPIHGTNWPVLFAVTAVTGYIAIIRGNETTHTIRLKVTDYYLCVLLPWMLFAFLQQRNAVMDSTAGMQRLMAELCQLRVIHDAIGVGLDSSLGHADYMV
jgi:hypothetical protein